MTQLTKRLLGVSASTVLLSLVSATAHAQTIDVLTGLTGPNSQYRAYTSTYTFNTSMILNSIGFVTFGNAATYDTISYSIGGVNQSFSRSALTTDGLTSWLTLTNPVTVLANQTVTVTTKGVSFSEDVGDAIITSYETYLASYSAVNPSGNVGFSMTGNLSSKTNSNLKVSNPSSNVAPEPGTFALALTGGGALIGICIRRRRNAG